MCTPLLGHASHRDRLSPTPAGANRDGNPGRPSFLHHAAIYGAGHLLVYAGSFLLLPLYVRCLTKAEYGTLDVLNRFGEIVLLCLLYGGLRQALLAFYNQAQDEPARCGAAGNALLLAALLLAGGVGLAVLFAVPLSGWLHTSPGLLRLAVAAVACESFALLLLTLAQARSESLFFAAVSVSQFLARAGLVVLLAVVLRWSVRGVLLAGAAASGTFALALLVREVCRGGLRIDPTQVSGMARFALPFVPAGLGLFLLNSGDRFFLMRHVSAAEVGAYALGYKLAMVVKELTRQPLLMVWSARMYEVACRPDAATVFGKVFTRVLGAYAAVGLALCMVQEEAILFLTGHVYGGAARVIVPVVLAYLFVTAAGLMDAAFYVRRKTGWKPVVMLASTVVVLGLYALLIPPFGMRGAAWATFLGFLFHAGLTGLVSQRVFPVRYEWGRLAVLLTSAAGVWLLSRLLPFSWWLLPAKAALWLLWPVFLWHTGVLSDEEKQYARDALAGLSGPGRGYGRKVTTNEQGGTLTQGEDSRGAVLRPTEGRFRPSCFQGGQPTALIGKHQTAPSTQ